MTIPLAPIDCQLLNAWTLLAQDATPHSLTGTTTETTLASVSLPGGRMGPNGILRISSTWSFNNSAPIKHPKIKLGGVTILDIGPSGAQITLFNVVKYVFNRNAQNAQIIMPTNFSGQGGSASAVVTTAIDTSAAKNIDFNILLASISDTGTLESYYVEVFYGA